MRHNTISCMVTSVVIVLVVIAVNGSPVSAAKPKTPKVLIIGIDGCRPDAMEKASTPHLDRLIKEGAYFEKTDIRKPNATDGANTVSGPGWSNLLCGVWPDKHAVIDNKFVDHKLEDFPHFFTRMKEARPRLNTASFSTWEPIHSTITTGAGTNRHFAPKDSNYAAADNEAAEACVTFLDKTDAAAVVLYLGQVDETGHKHGFHPNVPQYISAIETVDGHIGNVLKTIRERSTSSDENWLMIVCTDHGGIGTGHGGGHGIPEVRETFLIVSGHRAEKGQFETPTFQVDVVPTALRHLAAR